MFLKPPQGYLLTYMENDIVLISINSIGSEEKFVGVVSGKTLEKLLNGH